jgi:hypothetical protein
VTGAVAGAEPVVAAVAAVAVADGPGPVAVLPSLSREAELDAAAGRGRSELIAARREKAALEVSVQALQDRLTLAETSGRGTGVSPLGTGIGTMEANIRRGEREKDLEKQLVRAKKDKDKALRLLISLIGKVTRPLHALLVTPVEFYVIFVLFCCLLPTHCPTLSLPLSYSLSPPLSLSLSPPLSLSLPCPCVGAHRGAPAAARGGARPAGLAGGRLRLQRGRGRGAPPRLRP